MPRANRHDLPGYIWHITHRCHQKEFLLRFARDRQAWMGWLFEAKETLWAECAQLHRHLEPHPFLSRFVTFGNSIQKRLLVVAHAEEDNNIRIISARLVTRQERKIYEEG